MAEPLSPLKKKIRPLLTWSLRNSIFASVFIFLFGMCWRADHIETPGAGGPEKQKLEAEQLRESFRKIDQTARDLNSVTLLGEELWNASRTARWVHEDLQGPKLVVTYDMNWLEAKKEALQKQLSESSLQTEVALIHARNISERDFVLLSQEFMKSSAAKQLTFLYKDKLEGDYPLTHVNALHECQNEVNAKNPDAKSAVAIIACTEDKIDWRMVAQRTAMGGAICLGFMGRSLRKKWDKAAAQEQTVASAAPAPSIPLVTSQPITMKPIKISKKVA